MAVEKISTNEKVVGQANTTNKMDHTNSKSIKTVPKNGVGSCVHFCLRSLGHLERCALQIESGPFNFPFYQESNPKETKRTQCKIKTISNRNLVVHTLHCKLSLF